MLAISGNVSLSCYPMAKEIPGSNTHLSRAAVKRSLLMDASSWKRCCVSTRSMKNMREEVYGKENKLFIPEA